jgi:hypothetical protein
VTAFSALTRSGGCSRLAPLSRPQAGDIGDPGDLVIVDLNSRYFRVEFSDNNPGLDE